MAYQAKVDDIEVFRLLRGTMLKFAQAADQSISSADSYLQRMRFWLESEQMSFWEHQLRLRTKAVAEAKDALRQKKLYKSATGHNRDAAEEQKNLARALAMLEEAEQKIAAIRKWLPGMDRAADAYRGGVSRLRGDVMGEIPSAVAHLDRLAMQLEVYMQIAAPDAAMNDTSALSEFDGSVSRGDGDLPQDPTAAAENAPAPPTETKEGGDVAHGQ